MNARTRTQAILAGVLIVSALTAWLAYEISVTAPKRQAMRVLFDLVAIGNQTEMPEADRQRIVNGLISSRYLREHPPRFSAEGGIAGLPRTIDKNFKVWWQDSAIWVCATRRTSTFRPVYQIVREDGQWRFDGPVAVLRPGGELVRTTEPAVSDQP